MAYWVGMLRIMHPEEVYPIVWLEAVLYKVKDEEGYVVKRCLYHVLGILPDGQKEVLGASLNGESYRLKETKQMMKK